MSELIVKIRHVTNVVAHPNGDFLDVVQVDNGWECVVKKGEFKCGERVLFIPPDSVIPHSLHTFLGITKFCAHLPSGHPERNSESMRIKAAKVRGIPSFGVVVSLKKLKDYASLCLSPDDYDVLEHLSDDCGDLLKVMLKITKYVEPESTIPGEIAKKNDLVRFYHDIERWQNYPDWFTNGEPIVLLEKIHGCLKEDSNVLMSDKTEKYISDIKIGDRIISYDIIKNIFIEDVVENVIIQDINDNIIWLELEFEDGRRLTCTENHLILTTIGYIEAKNLTENHIILSN